MLDYEQIKEIINKIDGSSLRLFELEDKDVKLKLSKNSEGNNSVNNESNYESRIAREEVASTEAVAYSEPEVENKKVEEKEPDKKVEETKRNAKTDKKTFVENEKFPDCIGHWGTNVGMINAVRIVDSVGKDLNFFEPKDKIKIEVEFDTFEEIEWKYFSIAISIKNKEGTDLIVKTTYDEKIKIKQCEGRCRVSFEFVTELANGEYYLVVALENRKNTATIYYEYIEGAKYFKVFSNKRLFGVFDPPARIDYKILNDTK